MQINEDYEELFKTLNSLKIKYLVIGGYAYIFHCGPRFTKDIDVWISPEANKPELIFKALSEFGAPLSNLSPQDFSNKKLILQIGVAPVRIDILMNVPGVSFKEAWGSRKRAKFGETFINLMGIDNLIKSKKKANRPQDIVDIEKLKRAKG